MKVFVNGKEIPNDFKDGNITITTDFKDGDIIDLDYPDPLRLSIEAQEVIMGHIMDGESTLNDEVADKTP